MKEATGELNFTVITVIAIGLLVAFFYFTIWPMLDNNFKANSNCSRAVCENPCGSGNNTCSEMTNVNQVKCHLPGDTSTTFFCPWKG